MVWLDELRDGVLLEANLSPTPSDVRLTRTCVDERYLVRLEGFVPNEDHTCLSALDEPAYEAAGKAGERTHRMRLVQAPPGKRPSFRAARARGADWEHAVEQVEVRGTSHSRDGGMITVRGFYDSAPVLPAERDAVRVRPVVAPLAFRPGSSRARRCSSQRGERIRLTEWRAAQAARLAAVTARAARTYRFTRTASRGLASRPSQHCWSSRSSRRPKCRRPAGSLSRDGTLDEDSRRFTLEGRQAVPSRSSVIRRRSGETTRSSSGYGSGPESLPETRSRRSPGAR